MKVAVLGAGYAGVTAARRLEEALPDDAELVVVNDSPVHLVRHEVHRVVRDPDFAEEIQVPLADLLGRAQGVVARVESVDPEAGVAHLESGELGYDYAIVCTGAETAFYGLPGVEEHAVPLREVEHAKRIRARAIECLEEGNARVVVGGAGLSGVQVAGELATLARERDAGDAIDLTLLERLESVAPGFRPDFQAAIREELESRGVDVHTDEAVESATDDAVRTESGEVPYDLLVWTGGIRGRDAMRHERPKVRSDLRLGDGTFVVGDAGRVVDRDGGNVPASAQAAIKGAEVAAANVARLVGGAEDAFDPRLDRLEFSPRAWVVSVGDGAVAQVGPSVLRGRTALAVKASAGVGYLSSVGAVRRAMEVAREEFGGS